MTNPDVTSYERRQMERMVGAFMQLEELLPLIQAHASKIICICPTGTTNDEMERRAQETVESATTIRYLADFALLIASVERLRNEGECSFGTSLQAVYERIVPWPSHADTTAEIEEDRHG